MITHNPLDLSYSIKSCLLRLKFPFFFPSLLRRERLVLGPEHLELLDADGELVLLLLQLEDALGALVEALLAQGVDLRAEALVLQLQAVHLRRVLLQLLVVDVLHAAWKGKKEKAEIGN